MKKILLISFALVIGLYFLSTTPVFTCEPPPPPPPPPCDCDCSPGYWKNHTEVWTGQGIGGELSDITLLDMLTARGRGSVVLRDAAMDILNSAFAGECPCAYD